MSPNMGEHVEGCKVAKIPSSGADRLHVGETLTVTRKVEQKYKYQGSQIRGKSCKKHDESCMIIEKPEYGGNRLGFILLQQMSFQDDFSCYGTFSAFVAKGRREVQKCGWYHCVG
jgi:hypothetical protein